MEEIAFSQDKTRAIAELGSLTTVADCLHNLVVVVGGDLVLAEVASKY